MIIGAGAKLLGPIRIGDGARIGSNAVVVKDVEAGATMVGIPARPVQDQVTAFDPDKKFDAYAAKAEEDDPIQRAMEALQAEVAELKRKLS